MTTWHQLLKEGKERIYQAGRSDQEAMLLLNEICRKYNINLYMQLDEPSLEEPASEYLEGIHRLEKGEPLGYVLGYENFYGYDFIVNEDVLIPRPETEELTGQVLMMLDDMFEQLDHPIVFDVATGSGAIGITLSLENPNLDVYASDISRPALDVARANNEKLNGSVVFLEGSMLDPFIERNMRCDFLVCNPPYIPSEEEIDHSVKDYEPNVALFGGRDGLRFYREIFANAKKVMNPGGGMAFEIGWNQGEALKQLATEAFPLATVDILQDMSGKDRILTIRLASKTVIKEKLKEIVEKKKEQWKEESKNDLKK